MCVNDGGSAGSIVKQSHRSTAVPKCVGSRLYATQFGVERFLLYDVVYCARRMMKSSLGSASFGSPNSVLFPYCAVALNVAVCIGSENVAVVPSPAVARNVAVPSAIECIPPF